MTNDQETQLKAAIEELKSSITSANERVTAKLDTLAADHPDLTDEIASIKELVVNVDSIVADAKVEVPAGDGTTGATTPAEPGTPASGQGASGDITPSGTGGVTAPAPAEAPATPAPPAETEDDGTSYR